MILIIIMCGKMLIISRRPGQYHSKVLVAFGAPAPSSYLIFRDVLLKPSFGSAYHVGLGLAVQTRSLPSQRAGRPGAPNLERSGPCDLRDDDSSMHERVCGSLLLKYR